MSHPREILEEAASVLLVDWPSRDVPDTLARAGFTVIVKGGMEPDHYSEYELRNGEVEARHLGNPPARVDLVYAHRPLSELPHIVARAQELGATVVWCQSGRATSGEKDPQGCWLPEDESQKARTIVESAGLRYVDDVYIAAAVRELRIQKK